MHKHFNILKILLCLYFVVIIYLSLSYCPLKKLYFSAVFPRKSLFQFIFVQYNRLKKIFLLIRHVYNEKATNTILLLPALDDILRFISVMNKDNNGRPIDADVRSRFDRYRAQVTKAIEGKICT